MERWKINLYTVWFSQILSIMSFNFGMPFLPFYIQQLGITSPNDVKLYSGILNAAPAVTMAIMSPIWGIISDKYGRKLMLIRAMLFASFIIAGMGLIVNVNQLIILRLLQGIFTGTVTAAIVLVAANTPKNRLSFALGFLSSSTFIGQSIGPVIGGIVAEFVGYRVSFIVGGILMFLDFLLVLFIVKEEKEIAVKGEEKKEKEKVPMLSIFTATAVSMLIVLLFIRIGRTVFNPYIPIYVQEIKNTTKGIAGITGLINGFLAFTTALAGLTLSRLGDKYNKMKLLLVYLVLGAVFSIPLAYINNLWIFTGIFGMVFFITGGVEPVIMSITTEDTPVNRRGLLFGVQGTVGSIGFAVAPLLGGVISIKYCTKAVLLFIPVFLLISSLAVLVIMFRKMKNNSHSNIKLKNTFQNKI
ncbi:MFS transporter [Clostridium carboxidivorans P7]|uniref:Major facilitator superfamily MFS_1 n=1 Tax=Clostridium carboxidivorans P7 TaxID=536227 RepID=C6PSM0_9CLOT|nr:MFS transporter [Clostridium carboxidivorans]AKN30587.1 MFS transporter [Clostridium carboxidivorans P7]EET87794.1 major facilitator superfamily MFS_1 [Clostridium carboxidivorans P7]EFG86338.1 transporter, major facilitator family protein [Clostridium carboxidivorans P7]